MLGRPSLRLKLMSAFALMIAITVTTGYIAWSGMRKINAAVEKANGATVAMEHANEAEAVQANSLVDKKIDVASKHGDEILGDAQKATQDLLTKLLPRMSPPNSRVGGRALPQQPDHCS